MQSLAIVVSFAVTGFALGAFINSRKHITLDDIQQWTGRPERTGPQVLEGEVKSTWFNVDDEVGTN